MSLEARMRELLGGLDPESLEILDESALHAGHEGAKSGGGHYHVTIVSPKFAGQSAMARHRMVYGALSGLMPREIHALSIKALAPDEF
ncbi:MAG: BolA family protein [Pseudomonadota bacterium]